MTTSLPSHKWLTSFLCNELDAAITWKGSSQARNNGNLSFSSVSSQPQTSRFSDNGSVLHIANHVSACQLTLVNFARSEPSKAWMHDEEVRIPVRFTASALERYRSTYGTGNVPMVAGTVFQVRDFSVVVDSLGSSDEQLRLLIKDCVLAHSSPGVRFIDPNLARVRHIDSIQERLGGLFGPRRSLSSSQNGASRRTTPTVAKTKKFDVSSDSEASEATPPVLDTQVPLATQMPIHRPRGIDQDFSIASGVNLSGPIEARRQISKQAPPHLLALLKNVQTGFSHPPPALATYQAAAETNTRSQSIAQRDSVKQSPVDKDSYAEFNLTADQTMPRRGTIPTSQTSEENGRDNNLVLVGIKEEEVEDIHFDDPVVSVTELKVHSQQMEGNLSDASMDLDEPDENTIIVVNTHRKTDSENILAANRDRIAEDSLSRETVVDSALVTGATVGEVHVYSGPKLSCLFGNTFYNLQLLARADEDFEVCSDQVRILNKPESWQYPTPPLRLPQCNIPIALLKEFKQDYEVHRNEVARRSPSLAKVAIASNDAVSVDEDGAESSDDEEEAYSGWDASSSPDRMHQAPNNLQVPSSPGGPPAAILMATRKASRHHNLPPDSSAALPSEGESDELSPPSGRTSIDNTKDPRLALAQIASPIRAAVGPALVSNMASDTDHSTSQPGHLRVSDKKDVGSITLPEDDSSDIEMGIPKALPLPSSQLSRAGVPTSPALGSDTFQHLRMPNTPQSRTHPASPYQLVPGSFDSTQVQRYRTMQMPTHNVDGAAESKPGQPKTSPISIISGQRDLPARLTSPVSTGIKRPAPDSSISSIELPAQKRQREKSFDWDRQSQVEDPVELSRRMRREFLNQRNTIGTTAESVKTYEPVLMQAPRGNQMVEPTPVYRPAAPVDEENDLIMHDPNSQHVADDDTQDLTEVHNPVTTKRNSTSGRVSSGPVTTSHAVQVYSDFKTTYPTYSGDFKHFVNLCRMIQKLMQGQRLLHRSLWDDFIIRHKTDYPAYLMQCAEEGTSVKTYDTFYQDDIEEPLHALKVITPITLEVVLSTNPRHTPQKYPVAGNSPATPNSERVVSTYTTNTPAESTTTIVKQTSPKELLLSTERNAAASSTAPAPPSAAQRSPSQLSSSASQSRAPNRPHQLSQHPNNTFDGRSEVRTTSVHSPGSLTSSAKRAQDLLPHKHKTDYVNSPASSAPARNLVNQSVDVLQKESTDRKTSKSHDHLFFASVPTGPRTSTISGSRPSMTGPSIPGLNVLNQPSQIQGKVPQNGSRPSSNPNVQVTPQPRPTQPATSRMPPRMPPPAHNSIPPWRNATYNASKSGGNGNRANGAPAPARTWNVKRNPTLIPAVNNAPKRRDAAYDPAPDPTSTGQGKISEARTPKA